MRARAIWHHPFTYHSSVALRRRVRKRWGKKRPRSCSHRIRQLSERRRRLARSRVAVRLPALLERGTAAHYPLATTAAAAAAAAEAAATAAAAAATDWLGDASRDFHRRPPGLVSRCAPQALIHCVLPAVELVQFLLLTCHFFPPPILCAYCNGSIGSWCEQQEEVRHSSTISLHVD